MIWLGWLLFLITAGTEIWEDTIPLPSQQYLYQVSSIKQPDQPLAWFAFPGGLTSTTTAVISRVDLFTFIRETRETCWNTATLITVSRLEQVQVTTSVGVFADIVTQIRIYRQFPSSIKRSNQKVVQIGPNQEYVRKMKYLSLINDKWLTDILISCYF